MDAKYAISFLIRLIDGNCRDDDVLGVHTIDLSASVFNR